MFSHIEREETLSPIAGEDGEFPYEVEDKIKKVVELLADLYCSYITEKECCRSIEDNRKRYVWHAMARWIADWDLDEWIAELERERQNQK